MKHAASPQHQNPSSVIALIPARFASTRLSGKPLVDLCGKTMIQRVYEQTQKATTVGRVLVATDDQRIVDVVEGFGGNAVLTRRDHVSGTDRLAEVATSLRDEIIVNVQGDEPLISPTTIDAAVQPLLDHIEIEMSTTCETLTRGEEVLNPNIVKVVFDREGFALYFSRSVIPGFRLPGSRLKIRGFEGDDPFDLPPNSPHPLPGEKYPAGFWYKHTGLYVYRRELLLRLAALEPSLIEQLESLEQLRALYYGHRIKVVTVHHRSPGVDTPEDVEHVRRLILEGSQPAS